MKILTALQNPKTNEILKEKTKYNIIETDIQYQEGIIEVLEKNNKIDLIIISELLPGNIGFKDLINKIKTINNDIEIIVILENKNYKLKEFLMQRNIKSIFYNNEITIDELINVIEEKNKAKKEIEINNEIKLLREIIMENNKKIEQNKKDKKKSKIINILKKQKNKIIKNEKISNLKIIKNKTNKNSKVKNKIISVVGTPGVGKSIFISLFSKNVKNKKILIIDFDIYNKSLDLIFGYNTKNQKEKSIIKVNNNIELLSKIEIFFKENYIEKNKIRNILNSFSKKYDLIIGPTATTVAYKLTDNLDDPLQNYLDDVLVIPVNMAGLPGMNVPVGFNKDNMPIGLHIIGDSFEEAKMYQLAAFIEKKLNLDLNAKEVK